jgi:hypothetical protein
MIRLYLAGLGTLLLGEYGFQTRKRAVVMWSRPWIWRRTLLRLAVSGLLWLAPASGSMWIRMVFFAAWFILSELGAFAIRSLFRHRQRSGFQHGGVITHLFPIAFATVYLLVSRLLTLCLGPNPTLYALGAARVPLIIFLAGLILWTWGTFFTVSIIDLARPEQVAEQVTPRVGAGELIGILERFLTFFLVASGGWTAVGFVIAAKAAARFPQFEKKEFAEYFLLGSMSSVGLGIVTGILVRGAI